MSPSTKKTKLVRRSVVELDLVGYSHVARGLERQTDATVVFHLNDQVQRFVDDGLREVGRARKDVVNGTAGDNALLVFERASEAHRFSEAAHRATAKHNALQTDSAAHRHFRIGISTGEIAVRGREISGARIIDSVRLEGAGKQGHILIDEATYDELPAKFQQSYYGPESVSDKQNNNYPVYRFVVVETSDVGPSALGLDAQKKDSATSTRALGTVDISRIIKYAPAELIGREEELKLLNDAWDKVVRAEKRRPRLIAFVALGGEGKTSLVAKWAAEMSFLDWPGCDAVFAWSFYSQGTREQTAASSDSFLAEALKFFGDPEMAGSPAGAFDKGRRLAQLIGERRALLILDGVEPLQYAPTSPTPGELKDQGLAALLKGLAAASHGLCVVTTRYSLPDLRAFWQTTAPEVKLSRLSRDAGVHLLKTLGVTGTAKEFETLVEDVKGHALTLTLLGGFLSRAFHGDIRQRDRVKFEKADAQMDGGHAFRTMAAYEQWLLRDGGDEGRREVAVLRLMGLFDRPADAGCLAALRSETIPGLTESLAGLADDDWEYCISGLETAKLLTVNRDASGALISLDAHPHLRAYFAKQLSEKNPEAWRAGHKRLYEHLCTNTKEGEQPTLEDLQPLYQAVAHGCQAGLQQEALDKVWSARIQRRNKYYSVRKLGAFGSDLGAVACFFEQLWNRVSRALTENDKSVLMNAAASWLRALGRLTEALEPMRVSGEMDVKVGEWKGAAISYNNLSELELTLGEVVGAVGDAAQSVTYADRSGDAFERWSDRVPLANSLHEAGRWAEAEKCFREAEQMLAKSQPNYPLLYSIAGLEYCDLLLAAPERAAWQTILDCGGNPYSSGHAALVSTAEDDAPSNAPSPLRFAGALQRCRAVSQRAAQTFKWAQKHLGLLDIAVDHLTLGRASLYAAILERGAAFTPLERPNKSAAPNDDERRSDLKVALQAARSELDSAVDGLRRAGTQDRLPSGLLTRAWLRFLDDKHTGPESAQEDLDEAWEIAKRGPMKLFMADIHLYRARLFHAVKPYPWDMDVDGKPRGPKDDLAAARKLIEQCGYWRRKEELEDAEAAAKNW